MYRVHEISETTSFSVGRREKTWATSYRYGTMYMMNRGPKYPAHDEANTMDLLLPEYVGVRNMR